jgi:hypothetical protein
MNRILSWGFTLGFCALMAAMVVMVMPTLENYRSFIFRIHTAAYWRRRGFSECLCEHGKIGLMAVIPFA